MSLPSLSWLQANLWKYFVILFTSRRNFIPLLSIYYLSLPDAQAQEIGFYTAAWAAISLLFQIPAGIIGDKFWNKTTIIIAKICLLASSCLFVFGDNFLYFLFWSMCMSLGADAFATGNTSAFLHDTLTELNREDQFKKTSSTIRGQVSLLSVFFIVTLPFFTSISLVFPFKIGLFIDIIGLLVAFSLFPVHGNTKHDEKLSFTTLKKTLTEAKWSGLFSVILFSSIIGACLMTDGAFRVPYLTSLWYPIVYIGFVMWLSRLVWFVVGKYAHRIELLLPFKQLMLAEIILFSSYYISASRINNPYIIWGIFSLVIWYFWGRSDIYTDHIINRIPWKKYKSTILSIKWQIKSVMQIILVTAIWFVMNTSYKAWFLVLWVILFVSLMIVYISFIGKQSADLSDH